MAYPDIEGFLGPAVAYSSYERSSSSSAIVTMLSSDQLQDLRRLLQERQIGAGISLLEACRPQLERLTAGDPTTGRALGTLAQWVDVGYEGGDLLERLLERFPYAQRSSLPLTDYVQLRMAEAVVAMRS